jgi:Rrf2 family protein
MRMTMRSHYGAHAVIELARCFGQGPLQCAEIAQRQQIPEAYLDQLLSSLRRVGLVKSVRGPHGGHELTRHPRNITVGEVITALEGPLARLETSEEETTDWWSACAVRNVWQAAAEASQRVLDGTTIQALLEEQLEIRKHREQGNLTPTTSVTHS